MPVRGSNCVSQEDAHRRKEDILKKIHAAKEKEIALQQCYESSDDENDEDIRQNAIKSYKYMVNQTLDLPLEKLILTPEGCDIFDELCLRIDVNQKYAELLPQWKDIAHHLQVDEMSTKWVEVCVRPREGLTRAMLEIYMKDGGTLGEVFEALLELECLDILEDIRPKVDNYNKKKDAGELVPKANFLTNENFFSVLKTLMMAFGNQDPCQDLHKFSNGLKTFGNPNMSPGDVGEITGIVQSSAEVLNNDWPRYDSELHLNKMAPKFDECDEKKLCGGEIKKKITCKVLLIFSEDGVASSQIAIDISKTVETENCTIELFRLNENTLWYEVLVNPEACCMKWASEADYIMPILTPKFLREIHGQISGSNDSGLLPTSPILNKYMYNLARSQYTQNGCKNLKVRPLIPLHCLTQVKGSNAIKLDPLLAHTWKALKPELVTSRLKSMMNECVKRNNAV